MTEFCQRIRLDGFLVTYFVFTKNMNESSIECIPTSVKTSKTLLTKLTSSGWDRDSYDDISINLATGFFRPYAAIQLTIYKRSYTGEQCISVYQLLFWKARSSYPEGLLLMIDPSSFISSSFESLPFVV